MKMLFSILPERGIIKSSAYIFLANFSANLVLFFANMFLSKALGPEVFGTFRTVLYFFIFIPMLIEFGANVTLTRYVARFRIKDKKKINYLVRWFLRLRIISYTITLGIIFLLKDYIAIYFLKDVSLSYLIYAGMFVFGLSFFLVFNHIILGLQKFKMFALTDFMVFTACGTLAVLLSSFGVFYAIVGYSLGFLLGNLMNITFLFKKGIFKKDSKFDVKKIFYKFSLPMQLQYIIVSLFNIIVPVLSLFFSRLLIGYYSFAFMFYNASFLISNALSFVVFPKVSELDGLKRYADAKDMLIKAFVLYSFVMIVGVIGVLLFSEWFVNLISPQYLPSLFMFKNLICLGLIFGYNNIYISYLKGLGRTKKVILLVLLQNIILFALSFIILSMY